MRLCYLNSLVPIIVKKKVDGSFDISSVTPTLVKEVKHVLAIIKNVMDLVIEPEVKSARRKCKVTQLTHIQRRSLPGARSARVNSGNCFLLPSTVVHEQTAVEEREKMEGKVL